jgi:hypothetical protein
MKFYTTSILIQFRISLNKIFKNTKLNSKRTFDISKIISADYLFNI